MIATFDDSIRYTLTDLGENPTKNAIQARIDKLAQQNKNFSAANKRPGQVPDAVLGRANTITNNRVVIEHLEALKANMTD